MTTYKENLYKALKFFANKPKNRDRNGWTHDELNNAIGDEAYDAVWNIVQQNYVDERANGEYSINIKGMNELERIKEVLALRKHNKFWGMPKEDKKTIGTWIGVAFPIIIALVGQLIGINLRNVVIMIILIIILEASLILWYIAGPKKKKNGFLSGFLRKK